MPWIGKSLQQYALPIGGLALAVGLASCGSCHPHAGTVEVDVTPAPDPMVNPKEVVALGVVTDVTFTVEEVPTTGRRAAPPPGLLNWCVAVGARPPRAWAQGAARRPLGVAEGLAAAVVRRRLAT